MAGFFGMFDPTKNGPGVSKNAPQKRRFFLFFELYFRKLNKIIILNVLYVLCCLPIITIGPATAGMTYCMRNFVREEHADISDFFDQFKKNFWQGLVVGIVQIVGILVIGFGIIFYNSLMAQNNALGFFGFAFSVMAAFLFLFMSYYIYMIMVTFRSSFRQLFKNSFLFAFIGLGGNIITTVVLAFILGFLGIYVVYPTLLPLFDPEAPVFLSSASLGISLYIFLIPSFVSFLVNFNAYPYVKKLMIDPAMEEERIKREAQDKQDDTVFEDDTL